MVHLIFTLCLSFSLCYFSTALTCMACSEYECQPAEGCKAGIVKDLCNCCEVCAKALGEDCGGPFDMLGVCGSQLRCVKNETAGLDMINSSGKCKPLCGPVCLIYCENGNVLDENGCPTCSCKSA